MQSNLVLLHPTDSHSTHPKSKWLKVGKRIPGLYQYAASGIYHARVRRGGKLYRESLKTNDLPFAKRKLAEFKQRLERTDSRYGKISLVEWLEKHYLPTLRNSPGALAAKKRIIQRIKRHWFQARTQPMRDIRQSQVLKFLNEQYGDWSSSYWNSALALIRNAFAMAVQDHALMENPAADLTYRKRKKPIRLTPTFQQFQAIIADVRAQQFNREAEESADFLEFLGLAGLGQAEASSLSPAQVDLDVEQITVYRHKTDVGFAIPIYPQLRPLVGKLCKGKKHDKGLFSISQARKALTNACSRLGFPNFTQRSLRRMFITRAIERGVDVKVIAQWQGHKDGGKLILDTYSHVRPIHSQRMAALMTTEEPANVIPMEAQAQ
jgi:integrase